MDCQVIDLDVIRKAEVHTDPYLYFSGANFIKPEAVRAIQESYPDLKKPGWHPSFDMRFHGAFAALMADLQSDAMRGALAEKLGEDLKSTAEFITIRKYSAAHEGGIHVDGKAKVGNFLVYLNDTWDGGHDGCLRVLRGKDDFEDYVAEVPPTTGTIFGFRPDEHSWHGHLPFVGERRAIQVSWLRNEADLQKKLRRHRWQNAFKGVMAKRA